jgi:hypothetical protein
MPRFPYPAESIANSACERVFARLEWVNQSRRHGSISGRRQLVCSSSPCHCICARSIRHLRQQVPSSDRAERDSAGSKTDRAHHRLHGNWCRRSASLLQRGLGVRIRVPASVLESLTVGISGVVDSAPSGRRASALPQPQLRHRAAFGRPVLRVCGDSQGVLWFSVGRKLLRLFWAERALALSG